MAQQAFARVQQLAHSIGLTTEDQAHRAYWQAQGTDTATSARHEAFPAASDPSFRESKDTINRSDANEGHAANDTYNGSNEGAGMIRKSAGDENGKDDKSKDNDRSLWGATTGLSVLNNRVVDPDAEVDEEDQRLEALEDEARRAASDRPAEPQPTPERASDERTVKGCTGQELPRIVYATRTRAERMALITQKRLELARDLAYLQSDTQKVKEAAMIVTAKRLFLEQMMGRLQNEARGFYGDESSEDDSTDDNGDDSEVNGTRELQGGGNSRQDEEECGQEEDNGDSGPGLTGDPKTQVPPLSTAAKRMLRRMQKMYRSASGEDLEAADNAHEATHSATDMAGPSTSSALHPLGSLLAWDIDAARRTQELPRKLGFDPSALSPFPTPLPASSRPMWVDSMTPSHRVPTPQRRTWEDTKAPLFPGGAIGLPDYQPLQFVDRDAASQVPHAGPSRQGEARRPPSLDARMVGGSR